MISAMDDIKQNEHKLAEKAQRIFELQRQLESLEEQKKALLKSKPVAGKDQLSYEESIEFGKQVNRYESDLHELELQILKMKRQLSALELQAKKLMPVCGIKIKVRTYSPNDQSSQTYCIQQLKTGNRSEPECCLEVERL